MKRRPWRPEAVTSMASGSGIKKLGERVKDFHSRTSEVFVIAGDNRQVVAPGSRCDITVFDRHELTGLFKHEPLVRPNMGRSHIEAEDSTLKAFDASAQPQLQSHPGAAFFAPDPVSDLGDYD